jgi:hypothetical protein
MAAKLGGTLKHPPSGGYHSIHDYNNQLMVFEQQKKRLRQRANGKIQDARILRGNGF